VVEDHAVVHVPAAACPVQVVVAVVVWVAVGGPTAVAHHDPRPATGVQVAQVGGSRARAIEGMNGAMAGKPRQSERVTAAGFGFCGNAPQAGRPGKEDLWHHALHGDPPG